MVLVYWEDINDRVHFICSFIYKKCMGFYVLTYLLECWRLAGILERPQ